MDNPVMLFLFPRMKEETAFVSTIRIYIHFVVTFAGTYMYFYESVQRAL